LPGGKSMSSAETGQCIPTLPKSASR